MDLEFEHGVIETGELANMVSKLLQRQVGLVHSLNAVAHTIVDDPPSSLPFVSIVG